MQKKARADMAFAKCSQGGLTHAEFQVLWEEKLEQMREAGVDMPTVDTLHRNYLVRLNHELRVSVQSKDWRIDGPEEPPRKTETWEGVAAAVGCFLEERADIAATGANPYDAINAVDATGKVYVPNAKGGGGDGGKDLTCGYCHMEGLGQVV